MSICAAILVTGALLSAACGTSGVAALAADREAAAAADRLGAGRELARFMRESVNVPFSFAVLERHGDQRPLWYQKTAWVLRSAARDLVHWPDPPVATDSAREVFYTYAGELERQVALFEVATHATDARETSERLEAIRRTCNQCHRFFRPASVISSDVVAEQFGVPEALR